MEGNGGALAGGIFVDHVASALPGQREAGLLQHDDDLAGIKTRKLSHQTAISTVERLTETGSGISSPVPSRSWMWR